ncbi:TPA: site-2 protease family protein [Patescibacteria group bacterium]|uniref:Peptidase M50 n=1 Tax=Candidatus Gottesmanbacteria bacterium GW2011_GWA1_43_11 TaxID=1618436 RepID=A0A0G1FBP6_9BACT|nr:MAG: Peptidase M50 [Candidatus Gottesmanbacteria bacterium GW2011_GWA1_43_11]HCS78511.1 site-2 protease family protein [Patescibacteria group bacterium]
MNLTLEIFSFIVGFLAIVVAITVHEFAHAFLADRLGDPTPRLQGRLTLNPLAHLDPIGTLLLLIARFGWGKPVQFDPFNLRNPRRDAALISIAGPISNLLLATAASIVLRVLLGLQYSVIAHTTETIGIIAAILISFLNSLIYMNVVLAIFNLIPIHPLDGFKIVGGFLNPSQAREWYSLERYGFIFLILLIFPMFGNTAPISYILSPALKIILSILLPSSGATI